MQYVYAALWFIIAFILIFKMGKENRIFYAAGGLFAVFGVWWLIDAVYPSLLIFQGIPGIIFKILIAVVLIFSCISFYRERKKSVKEDTDESVKKK